jgi:biopolymer transport protein ExbB
MRYLDLFARGGVMMWPILVCLLIVIGVVVDRIVAFRGVESDRGEFLARLRNLVRRGDMNGVSAMCADRKTELPRMVYEAVSSRTQGGERVREVMDATRCGESFRLERRLPVLALTAAIAPMLGFLGTLVGMIVALRGVEIHPAVAASGLLAGHLWNALLPSAFGLAVGIPAYALHAYFVSRVREAVHDLEVAKVDVLDLLDEREHAAPLRSEDHHEKTVKRVLSYEEDEFFRRKAEARAR